jgi:hypothetical protein
MHPKFLAPTYYRYDYEYLASPNTAHNTLAFSLVNYTLYSLRVRLANQGIFLDVL